MHKKYIKNTSYLTEMYSFIKNDLQNRLNVI